MLKQGKFLLDNTMLAMTDRAELEEYGPLSTTLCNIQRSCQWWIGDMIVMGEGVHGDAIWQEIDDSLSIRLMENAAAVCRTFPPDRRNSTLSFTHHAMLCGLPEQLQDALLARAEYEGWDTQRMRRAVTNLKNSS